MIIVKNTTLVIMAAGLGSRFGTGIKQLAKIGPSNEIIMDYSVYDAVNAGFNKIVFIIRKDIEEDFKEIIGNRISKHVNIEYAFQALEDLPDGFVCPEGRTKPWGTGQAVLAAKDYVNEPFAIINADDYYGREAFKLVHDYLVSEDFDEQSLRLCLVGFILKNTLSDNGSVTRGVCTAENGKLKSLEETYEIRRLPDGRVVSGEDKETEVSENAVVSMNMWGCTPKFMQVLADEFKTFLSEHGSELKSEYLVPILIGELLKKGKVSVDVLESHDKWFGVTYAEDKEYVESEIRKLVDAGVYPDNLWGE